MQPSVLYYFVPGAGGGGGGGVAYLNFDGDAWHNGKNGTIFLDRGQKKCYKNKGSKRLKSYAKNGFQNLNPMKIRVDKMEFWLNRGGGEGLKRLSQPQMGGGQNS